MDGQAGAASSERGASAALLSLFGRGWIRLWCRSCLYLQVKLAITLALSKSDGVAKL